MEIMDYLAVARRRLWILILIPVLAAVAVAAYVVSQPTQYQGAAVITVPAMVGGAASPISGPQGQTTFASTFQATAQSLPVLTKVSKETGIGVATLQANLSLVPVKDSSIIRINYVSTDRARPGAVARSVATQTLTFLYGAPVTLAEQSASKAETTLTGANTALSAITTKAGSPLPDVLYQQKLQQLNNLQERQSEAPSSTISAAVTKLQSELTTLAPLVGQYTQAAATQRAAQTASTTAQQTLSDARQKLAAVEAEQVVNVQPTEAISISSQLLKKGLPAVAAGLFLAVVLIVVLELLRRRRRPDGSHREDRETSRRAAEEDRWASTEQGGLRDPQPAAPPQR